MIPILDPHQHLWDLTRLRLDWLGSDSPINRSYIMSDYMLASEGLNVVKTIYMEVAVDHSQHVAEAKYALGLCAAADNPMSGAVIGGLPASDHFTAYIGQFEGDPYLKGARQTLHGDMPAGFCLNPDFVHGVRMLGEKRLRFDICIRPEELLDAASLIDLCPETAFVLDHCGNANVQAKDRSQWERDISVVAKRPNVVCKISGIVASAKPGEWGADDLAPIILHCAEVFGKQRIFFASDWPVCTLVATYRQWVEALKSIVSSWSEVDQRALFYDNAAVFYDI